MSMESVTTGTGATNGTLPGLMVGPSVDQLLNGIDGQPIAPAIDRPVRAGVSSQEAPAKLPQALGRTAPPASVASGVSPVPSNRARDLGPAISLSSTIAVGNEGLLTQVGVGAKFNLDERTSVTTTFRERLRDFSQSGKESVLDTRLSAQIKYRAIDDPQVKLDLSLEGYGQFNQPLGGGAPSIQLGLRPGVGVSYSPTKTVSLGFNGYVDLSRTLPAGNDSIVVGGDVNASLTFGDGFKAAAGVRMESANLLVTGGMPRVAGFGSVTKQFGERLSVSAEVIGGFAGDPTLSTSFVGAGEVSGVIKATFNF
jgi:hypothetical protein